MYSPEHKELLNAAKEAARTFALPENWQDGRVEAHGFTVDSETTRDRDDAILITPAPDGTTRVDVTLADTSFISPDSPIAHYALTLGETQYQSSGNIPMLPRRLSEGALSLLDGEVRPGLTVSMIMDPGGVIGEATVTKSVINPARMTYEGVAEMTHGCHPDQEKVAMWRQYEAFAVGLLKGRRAGGALAFFNADRNILTNEEGKPVFLGEGAEHSGQVIVQELMILVNRTLATYADRNNIPSVYRRHEWVSAVDIRTVARLIEQSGRDQIAGLLENKGRGFYSSIPGRHDALNLPRYGRYSSPLRRGVDFISIGNLVASLDGAPYPYPKDTLAEWSERLTERERTPYLSVVAKQKAERKAEKRLSHQAEQLITLPKAEFNHVINAACETDELPPALAEAITHLIAKGDLPQRYLSPLLIRCTANEQWLELRNQLMAHLVAQPSLAKAILLQARTTQALEDLTFRPPALNGDGFSATVIANYPDGPLIDKTGTAPTKKGAESAAALEVLAQLAGVHLEAVEQPADSTALRNPVSLLNEFYQRQGGLPKFDTKLVDGTVAHAPVFECVLTLPDREEPITGIGRTKREADADAATKAVAAEKIIERMEQFTGKTKEAKSPELSPEQNPVSAIYELAQGRYWAQPVFETQRTGGHDHIPTFTSLLTMRGAGEDGEEDPTFLGQGPNAKIAKANAAQAALDALAPWRRRKN